MTLFRTCDAHTPHRRGGGASYAFVFMFLVRLPLFAPPPPTSPAILPSIPPPCYVPTAFHRQPLPACAFFPQRARPTCSTRDGYDWNRWPADCHRGYGRQAAYRTWPTMTYRYDTVSAERALERDAACSIYSAFSSSSSCGDNIQMPTTLF